MRGFFVKKDYRLKVTRFFRYYRAPDSEKSVSVGDLYVDVSGEIKFVEEALQQEHKSGADKDDIFADVAAGPHFVGVVKEEKLLAWPHCPPRLGRVSANLVGVGLHQHTEAAPLALQCRHLRAKKPGRRHFRFAILNAFGVNLGDCLVGMSAARVMVRELEKHFETILIDMFVGLQANPVNADILGHENWVGKVHFASPTLKEMALYDGYFDFSKLLDQPRFAEMPLVDWYLWWMGLDPDDVAAADKRNQLAISRPAWESVNRILGQRPAFRRILFNSVASVPLRSWPPDLALKVLNDLLEKDQQSQFVLSSPLPLKHPRVYDVSQFLRAGAENFIALTAQMDAIISVDTFSIHLADAFSIPLLGFYASVPPDVYPYYPLHQGELIPGGEKLSAYKKSKVSDNEWGQLKDEYEKAWGELESDILVDKLQVMLGKGVGSQSQIHSFYAEPHAAAQFITGIKGRRLRFENVSPSATLTYDKLAHLAGALVKTGSCVVLVAPGCTEPALVLARQLGSDGQLLGFEPRPLRRQLIAVDLGEKVPQVPVQWFSGLPLVGKEYELPREDPYTETCPLHWGNSLVKTRLETLSLDDLKLRTLSLLVILAPAPFWQVLDSIPETLRWNRPVVVLAPLNDIVEVKRVAARMHGQGYQSWIDYLEGRKDGAMLLLLVHASVQLHIQGMKKVDV